MSKVAVVFWSATGNTEAMADAVAAGAQKAGVTLSAEPVIIANETPDDDAVAACEAIGAAIA